MSLKAALIDAVVVGSGGFAGAVLRYGLIGLVQRKTSLTGFPFGTLAVNLLGCLLIGSFVGLVESRPVFGTEFRKFALIGLLGGFTTYSTFGYETFALIRGAEFFRAGANVGIHVVLGLLMVWAGYSLTAAR